MLGINNYELNSIINSNGLTKECISSLKELIGKSIQKYFVQWRSDQNQWNEDGPIILIIDNKQYEFTAFQLDYSLTVNKIDIRESLDWYGAGSEMPLIRKKDCFTKINTILNKNVANIYLMESKEISIYEFFGFEIEFKECTDRLQLLNGLDCNNIKIKDEESNYEITKLKFNQ